MDLTSQHYEMDPQMIAAIAVDKDEDHDGETGIEEFKLPYRAVIKTRNRRKHICIDFWKLSAMPIRNLKFFIDGAGSLYNRLLVVEFMRSPAWMDNAEYILADYTYEVKDEHGGSERHRHIDDDEPFAEGYEVTYERTKSNTLRMVIALPWEVETNIELYNGFPFPSIDKNPSEYCIHHETYKNGKVSTEKTTKYLKEVGMYQFMKVVLRKKERSATTGRASTGFAMSPTGAGRPSNDLDDLYG